MLIDVENEGGGGGGGGTEWQRGKNAKSRVIDEMADVCEMAFLFSSLFFTSLLLQARFVLFFRFFLLLSIGRGVSKL